MNKHYWNGSLITATRRAPSIAAQNGIFGLVSQQVFKSANKWHTDLLAGLTYSYWTTNGTNPTNQTAFDAFFSGTPAGTGVHSTDINWDYQNSRGPKPSYLPDDAYAWQVEGFIYIATAGTYYFGTGSDDGNQLTINGTIVTSHYGGRGVLGSVTSPGETGSISLSTGYVAFSYRMQEGNGGDGCYVAWKLPGEVSYVATPASVFYRMP